MVNELLLQMIGSAVNCDFVPTASVSDASEDQLKQLFRLAKRHDLAHIAGFAMQNAGQIPQGEIGDQFQMAMMQAIYRCARQEQELESISRLFEAEKIPFIPLKGAIIRKWYPENWLRTGCDVDILVHHCDVERAVEMLQSRLRYTYCTTSPHDVALDSPSGVHLELHFDLVDESVSKEQRALLEDVWETAIPETGWTYRMAMESRRFYFYNIAHFAKHFSGSGCGIRPFVDVWVMNHVAGYSSDMCGELLEQGELLTFAKAAERMADAWFSGGEKDALLLQIEAYILDNSVHGSLDNVVLANRARHGSEFKALMAKIFLRYDAIKEYYPILKKHKWLLPFVEVYRWFRLLFGGSAGRVAHMVKENAAISEDEAAQIGNMLHQLGL